MRFLALDSWRGVCAVFITLYHLPVLFHFSSSDFMHGTYMAVDFFFVLSGFVITHSYFHKLNKIADLGSFIIRRVARLWPLHVFMLILLVGYEFLLLGATQAGIESPRGIFEHRTSVEAIFSNVFFLHSMGLHDTNTWNLPSWSISVEFYTYMVFAVMAIAARKIWYVACVALVGMSAAVLVYISQTNPMYIDWAYDFGFFRCIMSFFSGSLAYGIYMWVSKKGQKPLQYAVLFEVLAVILVVYFITFQSKTMFNMFAPLIFGFTIFIFAFEGGAVSKLLKIKPIGVLGKWSYSIYLTHFLLIQIVMSFIVVFEKIFKVSLKTEILFFGDPKFVVDFGNFALNDLLAVVYLAVTLGFSALTYKYVELKGQKWINGFAAKREAKTTPPMPAE